MVGGYTCGNFFGQVTGPKSHLWSDLGVLGPTTPIIAMEFHVAQPQGVRPFFFLNLQHGSQKNAEFMKDLPVFPWHPKFRANSRT